MVLGMNCFGAPGAGHKVSPASKQLGGAQDKELQRVVVKEEASLGGRAAREVKPMGRGIRRRRSSRRAGLLY